MRAQAEGFEMEKCGQVEVPIAAAARSRGRREEKKKRFEGRGER